jgi:hypothetical protein
VLQPRDSNMNEFIVMGLVRHSFPLCTHSTLIFIRS